MADPVTLYRVMILYMLSKVDYPLTTTQITNVILENDYTNYFRVQETIYDLIASDLVTAEPTHSNTRLRLTESGRNALTYFADKVSPEIREEIDTYLKEHDFRLKQEISVYADYCKAAGPGWLAHCRIKNVNEPLVDLTINVKTSAQARAVCENWEKDSEEVYAALMDMLMR